MDDMPPGAVHIVSVECKRNGLLAFCGNLPGTFHFDQRVQVVLVVLAVLVAGVEPFDVG